MNIFNQVKNILGNKINPATDATLQDVKDNLDLLSFDSDTEPSGLRVAIDAVNLKIKNTSAVEINPAKEETLVSINSNIQNLVFDEKSELKTTGFAPSLSPILDVNDSAKNNVNLFTDESTVLLRRMARLMESKGTVDINNNKRLVIDGFGAASITGVGPSGDGVPLITLTNDLTASSITALTTPTTFLGQNRQMFQDVARDAYARAIRSRLTFQ